MEDPIAHPNESLLIIQKMIKTAQHRFSEDGHLYLLWGWMLMLISVLVFSAQQFGWLSQPHQLWSLTLLVFVYQTYYLAKRKKTAKVVSYAEDILAQVWIVFVILMAGSCILVIGFKAWSMMYPAILLTYGMPTFLSGVVLRVKQLKIGAVVCWGLALAALKVPIQFHPLLITIAVLMAWVIPGYQLKSIYQASHYGR